MHRNLPPGRYSQAASFATLAAFFFSLAMLRSLRPWLSTSLAAASAARNSLAVSLAVWSMASRSTTSGSALAGVESPPPPNDGKLGALNDGKSTLGRSTLGALMDGKSTLGALNEGTSTLGTFGAEKDGTSTLGKSTFGALKEGTLGKSTFGSSTLGNVEDDSSIFWSSVMPKVSAGGASCLFLAGAAALGRLKEKLGSLPVALEP
mmetsp:Transcript_8611/g.26417  ORF Transcript_8611/g.26417 Transcript_8611/m.26417 type:complete len:206 (-) Transcript_8611:404-1021(-)